jgi:iron complex transport system substrate-binding protein
VSAAPQRICSLLPSATEIVAQLGLIDRLVGVSEECRWPPEVVGKPVVSTARIDPGELSDAQIDRVVRESVGEGRSLYAVDAELIDRLAPDLIVTQDLCAVCAVSSAGLADACPVDAQILSLDPRTLDEVAGSVVALAEQLGVQERGREIARQMQEKVAAVERAVQGRPRPAVFVAEWIDPPYCGGHWVPEMVERAGGLNAIGRAGEPSHRVSWSEALEREPQLVVLAPCGFGADEAAARGAHLRLPCRTVAVDGDSCYSRPAPRLADGVRQLAHLIHPDAVPDPGLPEIELPRCG